MKMSIRFQNLKIFVIHSEKDDYIITELKKYFWQQYYFDREKNLRTTFDIEFLNSRSGKYTGEDFGKEIRRLFRICNHYLIIITNNSKCSIWVNQEIGYAFANL
jgi:hypothetical protein